MQIEGSIHANLIAAIASARRWRGRPVHDDTLRHWHELLELARQNDDLAADASLGELVVELNARLAERAP